MGLVLKRKFKSRLKMYVPRGNGWLILLTLDLKEAKSESRTRSKNTCHESINSNSNRQTS